MGKSEEQLTSTLPTGYGQATDSQLEADKTLHKRFATKTTKFKLGLN